MPVSLYLALKFLRPKRNILSVVSIISMIGVMLGVAVLLVVIAVMTGFDDLWEEKILGFTPHVRVSADGYEADFESGIEMIQAIPGVKGVGAYIQSLAILQRGKNTESPVLIGMDPEQQAGLPDMQEFMVEGSFVLEDDQVVLGEQLAAKLGVYEGMTVSVFCPASIRSSDELRLPDEVEVAGVFSVGVLDFDANFVFCSLELARELVGLDEGVHGLRIMIDDPLLGDEAVAEAIREKIAPVFEVATWKELNAQLFGVLAVEKNMMFLLLGVISVVAAFGIMTTLITVTYLKTREIGLLKSLGFNNGQVMRVFVVYGFIQGVLGTALGLLLGYGILKGMNPFMNFLNTRFRTNLFPPEFYHFLGGMPYRITTSDVTLICATALVFCGLAAWVPARRAAKLDPVRALRYE